MTNYLKLKSYAQSEELKSNLKGEKREWKSSEQPCT